MRIALVGPGIMPIPPEGWGACEILIWDLRCELVKAGHLVHIINTPDKDEIVRQVNAFKPDFVHVCYDEHVDVVPSFLCKAVAATSHYGYVGQPNHPMYNYHHVLQHFRRATPYVFSLCPMANRALIKAGCDPCKCHHVPNGVLCDEFRFTEYPRKGNLSICLGKVEPRKRQVNIMHVESIHFAGPCIDERFDKSSPRYLGPWTREQVKNNLTDYGNLVLLSDGEVQPLVCLEAFSCGLGVVVSEEASENLDRSLPFVTVIPPSKLNDKAYVERAIVENREVSRGMRTIIREHAEQHHDWSVVVRDRYIPAAKKVLRSAYPGRPW
jgi:glycosyltransferase involved in cell wall biosynthesis